MTLTFRHTDSGALTTQREGVRLRLRIVAKKDGVLDHSQYAGVMLDRDRLTALIGELLAIREDIDRTVLFRDQQR